MNVPVRQNYHGEIDWERLECVDLQAVNQMWDLPTLSLFSFQTSIKEGLLLKQTSSFQRWRKRYFKLRGRTLYYAKDAKVSCRHPINATVISTVILLLCLFADSTNNLHKLLQMNLWCQLPSQKFTAGCFFFSSGCAQAASATARLDILESSQHRGEQPTLRGSVHNWNTNTVAPVFLFTLLICCSLIRVPCKVAQSSCASTFFFPPSSSSYFHVESRTTLVFCRCLLHF